MCDAGSEQRARIDRPTRAWLDGLAVGASFLCLVHCLALPIAIAALPALSAALAFPDWTHAALLLVAAPLSFAALASGYRRHGRPLPMVVGATGLLLMALGVAFEDIRLLETGLTVAGAALVAGAHIGNWRLATAIRAATRSARTAAGA